MDYDFNIGIMKIADDFYEAFKKCVEERPKQNFKEGCIIVPTK